LLGGQVIHVAEIVNQPAFDELIDERLAESFDVHGAARREVFQAAAQPRGTRGVFAPPDHFVRIAAQPAAARRAGRGHRPGLRVRGT
jgi:hypothetical protein